MKTYTYTINKESLFDVINFKNFINEKNILIQVFSGQERNTFEKIIKSIHSILPHASCIGCSTDGEIDGHFVFINHTTISISVFDNTTIQASFVNYEDSYINGQNITNNLVTNNTKLLIIFAESYFTNAEIFLKGISSINDKVMIAGGMAGNNGELKQSGIAINGKVYDKGVVAVSLDSKILNVSNDCKFNWNPIGIEHTIDKVEGKRLYSISGMTPYDFYKRYLGKDIAKSLPLSGIEYPLVIKRNGLLVARVAIHSHDDGSISFAGSFKKGDKVRLSFGNVETILEDSLDNYQNLNKDAQSFYIYSCMARRRFMPDNIKFELEPFAAAANTSGFFTYGEFYHNNGHNELLNQTLTVIGLSESSNHKNNLSFKSKLSHTKNVKHLATIKALTNLIDESSKDYIHQAHSLEEEKKYSKNIVEMQKDFIKQTVHETNTPLSVIINSVELYKMEFGENKYLSHIEAAMKNMSNIYDDLSYLITQDHVQYPKYYINIVDTIRSRVEFFYPLASQVRLNISFKCKEDIIKIHFNETRLQRIIDNNIANAIKYSLENTEILISIEKKDTSCLVSIATQSLMIKDPKKIFNKYYRESSNKKGFGLGLNLVKEICDEDNVNINITSTIENTIFTYEFKI